MGYFIKKSEEGNEGLIVSAARRPATPIKGLLRYNNDTNGLEYYNGTVYVELAKTGSSAPTLDQFTGDGSTVTFNGMTYAPNSESDIIVFINGVYQTPVANYTVSGTDITFDSAPPLNMGIVIIHNLGSTYVADGNVYDVPNL